MEWKQKRNENGMEFLAFFGGKVQNAERGMEWNVEWNTRSLRLRSEGECHVPSETNLSKSSRSCPDSLSMDSPSAFPVSSSFQMVSPQPASQSTSTISANVNPFYLKLITGNIRTCQGCRSTLRTTDGKIPSPPYDLAIARAERRPYRDTSGNLRTPQKATAAHYHRRIECVKAGEPTFVPASLRIPSDIYSQLCSVHREYLRMVFGLSM